jgi:ADP-ribose pyrophosphatase
MKRPLPLFGPLTVFGGRPCEFLETAKLEEKIVTRRDTVFATSWFSVIAKTINSESQAFYSLEMLDYVTVLAVTEQKEILLVRQYRPAVERYTLELPSGHVEPGETPENAARRELLEETGYQVDTVDFLGTLMPDSGRLSNRLWCFFAADVKPALPMPALEAGVTRLVCTPAELRSFIDDGQFNHALHLGLVMLAVSHQKLTLEGI